MGTTHKTVWHHLIVRLDKALSSQIDERLINTELPLFSDIANITKMKLYTVKANTTMFFHPIKFKSYRVLRTCKSE